MNVFYYNQTDQIDSRVPNGKLFLNWSKIKLQANRSIYKKLPSSKPTHLLSTMIVIYNEL